ncbi:uncharacterized protein METZ01_LOCUS184872, partial [marine metagenome]
SDTSVSATVNVIHNDPQDSTDTFVATINVRADTAVLDLTSGAGDWFVAPGAVGDTLDKITVIIQNDGGTDLVVDSASLAVGTHFFHDLPDSTVIPSNGTASFKITNLPQSVGTHLDTLTFNDNTDSTSGESITMNGYGHAVTDTNWSFTDPDDDVTWTLVNGSYTMNHSSSSGYFYGVDGHIISPKVALDSTSKLHFSFRNHNASTFDVRIFISDDKTNTVWTGWTAVDTITVATSGTASGVVSLSVTTRAEVSMPASADTGYVGIQFVAPSSITYNSYFLDAVLPPQVPVQAAPVTTTTESFEGTTFPPDYWTVINDGGANGWSRFTTTTSGYANTGSYSARIVYNSTAHDDWIITPKMSIESGDLMSFYARNGSPSWTERFNVKVSTTGNAKADFTASLASNVGPPTSYTQYSYDLTAYAGTDIYVGIQAFSTNEWGLYVDDINIPWTTPDISVMSVSASSLNFYGVASDTAAGTGSHSLTTTISNSGADTLTGTIASRSTDFTVSPATVDLLPDSSMTLTITYAPSATGFDSSYVDITSNNGGVANAVDSVRVLGYAFEADNYNHFEFADYDSSGFLRKNTAGGTYWRDNTSTSTLGGSNSVAVSSHKYGGESWLITP